ncbi:hypothetical protein CLOHYLEM_07379 [[Clostridium] hylemonae DSM 15053]|uniref:Uncharacterized protein n=1 Tax=[Clostridium] hylemonae DSM 15053 TaxID=553973 RepID=C0C5J2_9FIRM|nr:hypothetical protein CLOHYLEM_07379 [[Clostridium] hylemonae DSM 15053]
MISGFFVLSGKHELNRVPQAEAMKIKKLCFCFVIRIINIILFCYVRRKWINGR